MCALALLCQLLEESPAFSLPEEPLLLFAPQHGSDDRLPTYELLRPALVQTLSRNAPTYIIIDALDEYHVGDVIAQTELIRELETLNFNLLVTSRTPLGAVRLLDKRLA